MKKTVFIIGAGAGADLKMPLGVGLKDIIARNLQSKIIGNTVSYEGDPEIYNALKLHFKERINEGAHIGVCKRIAVNMPTAVSIDEYIHSQGEDKDLEVCAKVAIAHAILQSERKSELRPTNHGQGIRSHVEVLWQQRVQKSWLPQFFNYLTGGLPFRYLRNRFESITLIIFNYDRCIEHYLYQVLQSYYKKSNDEIVALISKLHIYHPYGSVGRLHWQIGNSVEVGFGTEAKGSQLIEIQSGLKTFTESTALDDEGHKNMLAQLRSSGRLVFLGFAYHRQNMELMGFAPANNRLKTRRESFGTSLGLSENSLKYVMETIEGFSKESFSDLTHFRRDLNCSELFDEYSFALRV